jgi:hypothetical protein
MVKVKQVLLGLALAGFLGIGFLLFTHHGGAATKIATYSYVLFWMIIVYEFFKV